MATKTPAQTHADAAEMYNKRPIFSLRDAAANPEMWGDAYSRVAVAQVDDTGDLKLEEGIVNYEKIPDFIKWLRRNFLGEAD